MDEMNSNFPAAAVEGGQFRKKPVVVTASQWFQNGDHPLDGDERFEDGEFKGELFEGQIVRYYRHPDVPGESLCEQCGKPHHIHGWIDTLEQGHRVCPGDWIITGVKGERYPCKPHIFAATYEPAALPLIPIAGGEPGAIKLNIAEPPPWSYRDNSDFRWLPVILTGVTGVSDHVVRLPSGREHYIAKEDYEALSPLYTHPAPDHRVDAVVEATRELTEAVMRLVPNSSIFVLNGTELAIVGAIDRLEHALAALHPAKEG